jgi:predicted RNase H-like HicB family nuclease
LHPDHPNLIIATDEKITGGLNMRTFNVIIERDPDTGLLVGSVPGWPGAHSQGASFDELEKNLREVIAMLIEDGEPKLESEFVGLQTIQVA